MDGKSARARRPRTTLVIGLLIGLLVTLVVVAAIGLVWRGREEALAEAAERAERFVSSAEGSMNRALLSVDVTLAGMGELMDPVVDASGELDAAAAGALLAGVEHRNLTVRNLLLLDDHLRVVAGSQSDRSRAGATLPPDFLREVLAQPAPQLAISAPVLNFSTTERSLFFARPFQLRNGRRLVALGEMPVSLAATLLAPAAEIAGLQVTLERSDGRLLAAVPANELRLGQPLDDPLPPEALQGTPVRRPGRLDGEPSIVVARPALYPSVIIVAGMPLAVALQRWEHDRITIGAVAAAFIGMLLLAGWLAARHLRGLERGRSALAHNKALLDQALGSMADAFLLCDADDRVVLWNKRYLELFPWLDGVIAPGVPFAALAEAGARVAVPHGDAAQRKAWIDMRMAIRERGRGMYELEWVNGMVVDAVERRTPDGGTVSVIRDITAAERELTRAKSAAEAANESKSRFLAAMSHEMRTPLNAVLGMNRLMLKSPLNDEQRRYALMIRSSGQALLELINDILDLSKIEAGRMELEIVDFNPLAAVEAVVALMAPRAHTRSLSLTLEVEPGLPAALRGDPLRLRQVLLNLVGNALKFTEQGGVKVQLRHRQIGADRLELRLAVHDTGIGIAPEALPKLFSRFVQADSTTSRRYGGTGLGLAISAEMVALMGGRIDVRSEVGRGSTFEVVLPMPFGDERALEPVIELQDTGMDPLGSKLRVLVAEDNEVNQLLIQALLKEMGHDCDIVANGREAVHQVQQARYDLVLMDVQMPEMDGEAATRAIRALPGSASRVPVIALTANAMVEDRDAYIRSGMDDFVMKPVHPPQLAAAIARVMG
jgi:signal transduction histidine kinase